MDKNNRRTRIILIKNLSIFSNNLTRLILKANRYLNSNVQLDSLLIADPKNNLSIYSVGTVRRTYHHQTIRPDLCPPHHHTHFSVPVCLCRVSSHSYRSICQRSFVNERDDERKQTKETSINRINRSVLIKICVRIRVSFSSGWH